MALDNMVDLVRRGRKALYYVGLGGGALLFLYQLWNGVQGLRQQGIGGTNVAFVVGAVGLVALGYLLQMLAWASILRGLGSSISLRGVFSGYVLSFLPRYIPGSVWGYLGRSEWLKTRWGIPYARSALSSVLEIAMGLLTAVVVIVGCYAWYAWPAPFGWLAILGGMLAPWLSWHAPNLASRLPPMKRLSQACGFDKVPGMPFADWLAAYLIYVIFWFCYGGSLTLLLYGLVHTQAGLLQSTFAYSLSWLVGFLVLIAPAGLGVRELVLSSLLVWELQLAQQPAGSAAVVCRFAVYSAELLWLVVGLLLPRVNVPPLPPKGGHPKGTQTCRRADVRGEKQRTAAKPAFEDATPYNSPKGLLKSKPLSVILEAKVL